MRHAIQDLIYQRLIDLSRLSLIASPPLTYSTHAIPPLIRDIYHLNVNENDVICMMDQINGVYKVVDDDGVVDSPVQCDIIDDIVVGLP